MQPKNMSRRWRAAEVFWLSSLFGVLCQGYTLDATNSTDIKYVASEIAYDLMGMYTGNNTGDVPGNLPSPYYWWEAGAMFGQMIQYWYYTGDTTYNTEVKQAMLHQVGTDNDFMPANQTKTEGNDDQVFWAFAAMDAAELNFTNPDSDEPQWLALAQAVFNEQAARWDTSECGGGLRWQIYTFNAGYDYKNTISNSGFFQLAARLARYTSNDTYADWAIKEWDWYAESVLFDNSTWKVFDGTSTTNNCSDADQLQWTYNYATWIGGMAYMYNHTEEQIWLTRIEGLLNTTLATFFPTTMGDKIMVEVACEAAGTCDVDQLSFKAYLSRSLAVTAQLVPQLSSTIYPYLTASAVGAAGQCSGGDTNYCGSEWNTTTWDGTKGVGQQMSALAVVGSLLIETTVLDAPYSNTTGGTSQGDSSAGTGSSGSSSSSSGGSSAATRAITLGDRVGAGVVTAAIISCLLGGGVWLVLAE